MPKFSVITATKNALPGLKRTHASLLSQTYDDFEWVVIDGASGDGTSDWLLEVAGGGMNIKVVSEPDTGIAAAWNKGIDICDGEQILILNAGDTYTSHALRTFSQHVSPLKITCAHANIVDASGRCVSTFHARPHLLWRGMHLPHNWAAVPSQLYKEFGDYPDVADSMDFAWFNMVYTLRGKSIFTVVNAVLGSYELGGHSDKNFVRSFAANARILRQSGRGLVFTEFLRAVYTLNHIKGRILRRLFQ